MDGSWTIAELAEQAAGALAAGALAAGEQPGPGTTRANGRIRDVPNERLIRWYATVGLVDPPLSRRGRVARYGQRHLLQLVAIKRRQADGRSLADIQAELAGATDATLAAVAHLRDATLAVPVPGRDVPVAAAARGPDAPRAAAADDVAAPARVTTDATGTGRAGAAAAARAPGRLAAAAPDADPTEAAGRFWARRPEPATRGAQAHARDEGTPEPARPDAVGGGAANGHRPRPVPAIRLAPGVTLLLDGAEREPGQEELTAIAVAAGPLLEFLARTGLRSADPSSSPTAAAPGRPPDDPGPPEPDHPGPPERSRT